MDSTKKPESQKQNVKKLSKHGPPIEAPVNIFLDIALEKIRNKINPCEDQLRKIWRKHFFRSRDNHTNHRPIFNLDMLAGIFLGW